MVGAEDISLRCRSAAAGSAQPELRVRHAPRVRIQVVVKLRTTHQGTITHDQAIATHFHLAGFFLIVDPVSFDDRINTPHLGSAFQTHGAVFQRFHLVAYQVDGHIFFLELAHLQTGGRL